MKRRFAISSLKGLGLLEITWGKMIYYYSESSQITDRKEKAVMISKMEAEVAVIDLITKGADQRVVKFYWNNEEI